MHRYRMRLVVFSVWIALTGHSCRNIENKEKGSTKSSTPLFSVIDSLSSGITFKNRLIESDSVNPINYQYVYNGSGVAIGDVNNDGLQDLFFGSSMGSCKLYLNKGNMAFEDVTQKAGLITNSWCTGVTMSDVNADGFLDIYVCCSGKLGGPQKRANLLFINNQNLTFSEKAEAYGINDQGYSSQASFFDYDRDGDLDLFVLNQPLEINFTILDKDIINKNISPFHSSHFYKNTGDNHFIDVSKEAGVESNCFSLSCMVSDINQDGWPDIYVCNDYTMCDFLYINNKHGGFSDDLKKCIQHTSNFAMGCDIADFNNDGLPDILQSDMLPETNYRQKLMLGPNNYDRHYFLASKGYGYQLMQNCLQLNNGNGTFSEIASFAGIEKTDWTWSSLFADFDNDGWKDIFLSTGYLRDYTNMDQIVFRSEILRQNKGKIPNPLEVVKSIPVASLTSYVYGNNKDLTFSNRTKEWGLQEKMFANGAAYGDLDNDGDLDLVVNNLNQAATLFRNNADLSTENKYLTFRLKGSKQNPFGIGSTAYLFSHGMLQTGCSMPARGFCSAVDARIHFGLGRHNQADSVFIFWPDGRISKLFDLIAGKEIEVDYANSGKEEIPFSKLQYQDPKKKFFSEIANAAGIDFQHKENDFIDFKREPLLSSMYSRLGPALASGDVNKDGLDDVFVGGASGQYGCLYIQQKEGTFKKSEQLAFSKDQKKEDIDALFFDADGDHDVDLYVVSGGSEVTGFSNYYQDRLYLNNGKGDFEVSAWLPEINSSGSCVRAIDFDGDGDLDLFRGGRVSPGNYPYHPRSYLLQNNHGRFSDATEQLAPGLSFTGMVTDACWLDYDKDGKTDLAVTGEWMPIRIFRYANGRFTDQTTACGLDYSSGWWNCLVPADLDQDGDMDLVAGNLGTNSRIKTSSGSPAGVYARDFDSNGSTDAIICYMFSDSNVYPMNSRDELIDQMRGLRKVIPSYQDYANKTIDQLIPMEELKKGLIEKAYTFQSSWLENNGNGNFTIKILPPRAQISQMNSIIADDFNHDGHPDLLLAGNNYSISPTQGRLDAGTGLLLFGNGKGNFNQISFIESGIFVNRDVKRMVQVNGLSNKKMICVGNNNSGVQLFNQVR